MNARAVAAVTTPGRDRSVRTDDGLTLQAREVGAPDAPLTAVFCHGLGLHMGSWSPVATKLRRSVDPGSVRMVFFDHRGHGGSRPAPGHTCTVEQLGRDLAAVLDQLAPAGPVMLVGHSLGGMTILSYAAAHPDAIGTRIVGVGLVATAADRVGAAGIARLLRTPAPALLRAAAALAPRLVEHGWDLSRRAVAPAFGAPWCGNDAVNALWVAGNMIHRTPIATLAGFLTDIPHHDRSDALTVLDQARIPVTVVCGTHDLVLPLTHSQRIADAIDTATLVAVPGARHMVGVEAPTIVSTALRRLLLATHHHARDARCGYFGSPDSSGRLQA